METENFTRFEAPSKVEVGDSGLNKPFDRILKAFVDEALEIFLRLLGIVPRDAEIRLGPLRPETAPSIVIPDFVAWLEVGTADPVILHIKFLAAYNSRIPATMARYGGSLAWQYGREVLSLLILLRRKDVPQKIPPTGEFVVGGTVTTHPFRTVRLWDVDPSPVLDTRNPRLLPWSVLMKSSDETVRRIAEILARDGDQESVGRFLTLGSLRYDRGRLEEMLGGPKMGLMEAIIEGSWIFREATEKGLMKGLEAGRAQGEAEGRAQGEAEGRAAEARRVLRIALKAKFPGFDTTTEIDAIQSPEALESLVELTVVSSDRSEVQRAISSAVPAN